MAGDISYTAEEVAKILKISRYTVYDLINGGDLAALRIGRRMRIEGKDLEAYKQKAKGAQTTVTAPVCRFAGTPSLLHDGVIICGQDLLLDVLARHLEKQLPHIRFLRQYIGSIDGLLALYKETATVVTTHLWDSDADEYNVPYVRRLLPGHRTVIVNLVYRMEGFYVAKGNPKAICDWPDLTKEGVRFVNRERGSGARVLVDEKLRSLGIDRNLIQGYEKEEMSHLAVASAVSRNEADAGVGIEKTAGQVQGIDFIPLQKERYDLVVRKEDTEKPYFQALITILHSPSFRNEVAGVGGYDLSRMGDVIAEI